ncbi:MAG: M20 family metallopeptidase [Firmicutes bacterium]|jgi:amidohydrolase|nr:M20 family metallopeptidase [Bacillota bacterium]
MRRPARAFARLVLTAVSTSVVLALLLSPATGVAATDPKAELVARIDSQRDRLVAMSDWMYLNPEIGHKEFKAVEMLTGYLKENGWEVKVGFSDIAPFWVPILERAVGVKELATAFKATYPGQGDGPTIGIIVEYDALRGPAGSAYHGCQHNLQAPAGIGAAVALAETMKARGIPGKVVVFGTPAEEITPPVKAIMWDSGIFAGVDVMVMFHGSTRTTYQLPGPSMLALDILEITFKGKPSHAASAPWAGRSALDAVILFYVGMDQLREHSDPYYRMHGNITDGGAAPNIVPERAQTVWAIRHPKRQGVNEQVERVKKIAQGAAMMTETTVIIDTQGYMDNCLNLSTLENAAFAYAKSLGATNIVEPIPGPRMDSASTDFGTVSYNIPSISLSIQTAPEGTAGHSQANADATIADIGHDGMIIASKVEAMLAWDLLTQPDYLAKVKAEHAMLKSQ